MSELTSSKNFAQARDLMAGFVERTGLKHDQNGQGDPARRYLWTDAFALLNLIALHRATGDKDYEAQALRLIKQVHCHLGQFAENDEREGWLSSLSPVVTSDKAPEHPTARGLRIGKSLPERSPDESYDSEQEWDRDGQYFHYHTRWVTALLTAATHFCENDKIHKDFARWAYELSAAGAFFIEESSAGMRMHWKMSLDLSRPLVPMMGAHDPLEGLICARESWLAQPQTEGLLKEQPLVHNSEFEDYVEQLQQLCARSDWATDDPLGLGALALNVVRTADLQTQLELPKSARPERLLEEVEQGVEAFAADFDSAEPARYRLAFRECGLSLGLRALHGNLAWLQEQGLTPDFDGSLWQLADEIESFWLNEEHQQVASFQDHLDINEVTLASSLLAKSQPELFTRA